MSRAVLVTGSSRGIGRAVAARFADLGDRVAVHYGASADEAERTLSSLAGSGHCVVQADMDDAEAVQRAVDEAAGALGGLEVLVNNAGVFTPHPSGDLFVRRVASGLVPHAWRQPARRCERDVLCRAASRRSGRRGSGQRVEHRGFRHEPQAPAYGASKAGMNAFGQSMALTLAPHGISVGTVAPGFVETHMARESLQGASYLRS